MHGGKQFVSGNCIQGKQGLYLQYFLDHCSAWAWPYVFQVICISHATAVRVKNTQTEI